MPVKIKDILITDLTEKILTLINCIMFEHKMLWA